jgi:hypothetical protein
MYNTVKQYYDFLRNQEEERQAFLEVTKNSVIEQMDVYMSNHGWTRMKGKSKIRYTKKFNGKDIVVEYRCNYKNDFSKLNENWGIKHIVYIINNLRKNGL